MKKISSGEELLHKLYKNLNMSQIVLNSNRNSKNTNPVFKINKYLKRLEETHSKAKDDDRMLSLLKELYYEKYIIKEENVPESYFKLQQKIAFEQGHGRILINENMKKEMIRTIIDDQKTKLDLWLDYFISDDSKMYPMWFKYWAFQGFLKVGNYDKETNQITKRSKKTVAPFIDLNQEVLANVYDYINKYLASQKIDDIELAKLIEKNVFEKIYVHLLMKPNKIKATNNEKIKGKWVRYNQGSNYIPLWKSLQGYGTGWCTAGESTAKSQLSLGDFYVYYTSNENEEFVVPRIAIRMENYCIAEIRGVAANQHLEAEMNDIVEEKLNEFSDKKLYKRKVSDMKKLTDIYIKNERNLELTEEEINFLYEIKAEIIGFGFKADPRIEEIKNSRNMKKDIACIYGCKEQEVALTRMDVFTEGKKKLFYGNLDLKDLMTPEGLTLPEMVEGHLYLTNLRTGEGLVLPEIINGNLDLYSLETAEGLTLPKIVNGGLGLNSLETAEGLTLPKTINGTLELFNLRTAEGLTFPETINGGIELNSLETAEGLVLPETINGNLDLGNLRTAEGLTLPKIIKGRLDLENLRTAEGLTFPETINGYLNLSSLETAENLVLPKIIKGLDLENLRTAEDLVLPETINGNLNLANLRTAEGLTFPETIKGELNLCSLKTTEGLALPLSIGNNICLDSLEDITDLVIPDEFTSQIYLPDITITGGTRAFKNYKNKKLEEKETDLKRKV